MLVDRFRLPLCAHRLDGFVQFALSRVKMLLSPRAMTIHIVVVRHAGMIEFVDGFLHVNVNRIQIVPIMNSFGNRDSAGKRQTHGNCSNGKRFLHNLSSPKLSARFFPHPRTGLIFGDDQRRVKKKHVM